MALRLRNSISAFPLLSCGVGTDRRPENGQRPRWSGRSALPSPSPDGWGTTPGQKRRPCNIAASGPARTAHVRGDNPMEAHTDSYEAPRSSAARLHVNRRTLRSVRP